MTSFCKVCINAPTINSPRNVLTINSPRIQAQGWYLVFTSLFGTRATGLSRAKNDRLRLYTNIMIFARARSVAPPENTAKVSQQFCL